MGDTNVLIATDFWSSCTRSVSFRFGKLSTRLTPFFCNWFDGFELICNFQTSLWLGSMQKEPATSLLIERRVYSSPLLTLIRQTIQRKNRPLSHGQKLVAPLRRTSKPSPKSTLSFLQRLCWIIRRGRKWARGVVQKESLDGHGGMLWRFVYSFCLFFYIHGKCEETNKFVALE